jgi:hypothetical protein
LVPKYQLSGPLGLGVSAMFHPFLGGLPFVIFDAGCRLPASAPMIRGASIRQNVFLPLKGIATKIRQYIFRSNEIYGMTVRPGDRIGTLVRSRRGHGARSSSFKLVRGRRLPWDAGILTRTRQDCGDDMRELVVSIEKKLRSPERPGSVR